MSFLGLDDILKKLNNKESISCIEPEEEPQPPPKPEPQLPKVQINDLDLHDNNQSNNKIHDEDFMEMYSSKKISPQPKDLICLDDSDDEKEVKIVPEIQEKPRSISKSPQKQDPAFMFEGLSFCIIPFGQDLAKTRYEIFQKNIRQKGGKLFNYQHLEWGTDETKEMFLVTSKEFGRKDFLKMLPEQYHDNVYDYVLIDAEWISACLTEKVLADPLQYYLQWTKDDYREEKDEFQYDEKNEQAYYNQGNQPINKPSSPESGDGEILPPGQTQKLKKKLSRGYSEEGWRRNYFKWKQRGRQSEALQRYLEEEQEELACVELEHQQLFRLPVRNSIKSKKAIMQSSAYLFDYLDGCDDFELKKENIKVDTITKLDIKEYDDGKRETLEDFFQFDDDEQEIIYLGKKEGTAKIENIEYSGTLLDGVEGAEQTKDFKLYKAYNPTIKAKAKFWDNKKEKFVCQTGSKVNFNANVTDELDKLLKVYTNEKDIGRMHAYRKAISIIKSIPYKIQNLDQMKDIRGIGQKIKEKIKEIISTGKLKKAELLTTDKKQVAIETLSKVWGIGVQTAIKLYQQGIKSIDVLRQNAHLLNDNQKIGLKYFHQLQKRMPRDEVTAIVDKVRSKINDLAGDDQTYEAVCCGSYRRGKPTCGDIDILITRKDGKPFNDFLKILVDSLEGVLLTDHLARPKLSEYGSEMYMGICCNGGLHRRIDIKIYPREQFGYAVLYFTGSDYFNRSMRLYARKKGLTLSDHGLYPTIRNKADKVWTGQNIPCYDEREVFKVMGLDYRAPNEREV